MINVLATITTVALSCGGILCMVGNDPNKDRNRRIGAGLLMFYLAVVIGLLVWLS